MGEKVKMTQVAKPGTAQAELMKLRLKSIFDERLMQEAHQLWVNAPVEYKARKLREAKGE